MKSWGSPEPMPEALVMSAKASPSFLKRPHLPFASWTNKASSPSLSKSSHTMALTSLAICHGSVTRSNPPFWSLTQLRRRPLELPKVRSGQPSLFQSAVLTAAPYVPFQLVWVMPNSGAAF